MQNNFFKSKLGFVIAILFGIILGIYIFWFRINNGDKCLLAPKTFNLDNLPGTYIHCKIYFILDNILG